MPQHTTTNHNEPKYLTTNKRGQAALNIRGARNKGKLHTITRATTQKSEKVMNELHLIIRVSYFKTNRARIPANPTLL